jgi:hypothetical protein
MTLMHRNLRVRVTLAFTLMGALLSLLFAAAALYITEDYEQIVVDEILRGQAEDYRLRLSLQPLTPLPRTHRLSGYLRTPEGHSDVPPELRAFGPGIHEIEEESDDGVHVGVFDTERGRLYFVIDLSDIERLERHLAKFLTAIVVFGTALSGWLGWLLARATIAPVRRLAAAVDGLPTHAQPTSLGAEMGSDELGRLAHAIDGYQARLVEADASERSFFADASHELRTPVAVVRGAVELLLDEPIADEGTRRRVQRLDRGIRELGELLDIMFGMVRGQGAELTLVDARALLRDAVAEWTAVERSALSIRIDASGRLRVTEHEALLVLRGILRRLVPQDATGILAIGLSGQRLELSHTAVGSAAPSHRATAARSDRGLGLTLVGRLAQRIGWRIEECTEGGRLVVHLHLPASAFDS